MKIETSDCVAAIVDYFIEKDLPNYSLVRASSWKRVSKSGKGDSIIRVFRNSDTKDLINVTSSEHEILSVSETGAQPNVSNFKTFVAPQKRTMKCKCKNCGSSEVMLCISPSDGEDGYDFDPNKLTQKKAKKLVKNSDESIWICLGKCEDETSAVVEIDGKKITDSDDFIEYIADYGNPKLDKIDTNSIPVKKKNDIIKAVKIGDLEEVREYIKNGGDLDSYIGDLPENKDTSDRGNVLQTLLLYAIDQQQWEVAVNLINGGCDVNKPYKHIISTPLMEILSNKYKSSKILDVIDALMSHGADLSIKTNGYNDIDLDGKDAFDCADMWSKKQHKQHIIDNYPKQYQEYLKNK